MSYSKTIDQNLTRAFNLVKDLAVMATLNRKGDSTFNFSTRVAKISSGDTLEIKIIVLDTLKPSKDRNTQTQQIMFKTSDVSDITLYDTIIINEILWKIIKYIKNDGFITIVEIGREG